MPYLNWKQSRLTQEVRRIEPPEASREVELSLVLEAGEVADLASHLEAIFTGSASGELRVDLPRGWALFWKLRESESRVLMAHPEQDQWVATLALEGLHGKKFSDELRALKPGQGLAVSACGSVGGVSNLELIINLR